MIPSPRPRIPRKSGEGTPKPVGKQVTHDDDFKAARTNICKFFRRGHCRFSIAGKGCPKEHPKICKKFMEHGLNDARGVQKLLIVISFILRYASNLFVKASANLKIARSYISKELNNENNQKSLTDATPPGQRKKSSRKIRQALMGIRMAGGLF